MTQSLLAAILPQSCWQSSRRGRTSRWSRHKIGQSQKWEQALMWGTLSTWMKQSMQPHTLRLVHDWSTELPSFFFFFNEFELDFSVTSRVKKAWWHEDRYSTYSIFYTERDNGRICGVWKLLPQFKPAGTSFVTLGVLLHLSHKLGIVTAWTSQGCVKV